MPSTASPLPADLAANPLLARWLDFSRAGVVTIRSGKVEYGQGIWTALAQIAAEELELTLGRVQIAPVCTGTSPDEGITAGSRLDPGLRLRPPAGVRASSFPLLGRRRNSARRRPRPAWSVADGQIRTADGAAPGLSYWSLSEPD